MGSYGFFCARVSYESRITTTSGNLFPTFDQDKII